MKQHIVIAGGGLVGFSLALALAKQTSLTITVVDAGIKSKQPIKRGIVLSYSSKQLFTALNLWNKLSVYTTAINQIHVSDQGHFGFTRLNAEQFELPALGYVVPADQLMSVLHDAIKQREKITLIQPDKVVGVHYETDQAIVECESNKNLACQLVIAADGQRSKLRQQFNFSTNEKNYHQSVIVANVQLQQSHNNTAYERFTHNGPLAMLPLAKNEVALIWTMPPEQIEEILSLSDDLFLEKLQQQFGYRLGVLQSVGPRHHYPLRLVHAESQVSKRVVLVGNAAHTLHPVAGQGLNLALRDVAALAEIIITAIHQHQDIGSEDILNNYQHWRHRDQKNIIRLSDSMVQLFSNNLLPLVLLRNMGMLALDQLPPVKALFTKHFLGFGDRLSKLVSGVASTG